MKTILKILCVVGCYGCITVAIAVYGIKAGALMMLALVMLGILEGIV